MTPWTNYTGDQHIARGLDSAANAIADYTKTQQQAAMQHGFVQEAVNRGLMQPESLADFAKGNVNKKLQIGADAALALKMMMDQQQVGVQQQRNDIMQTEVAQRGSIAAAELGQRNTEFQRRGDMTYTTLPGGGAVLQNPGTGQQQYLEDGSAGDEWPPQIYKDPNTGVSFIRRGGKAFPINQKQQSALDQVLAQIVGQSAGVQVPQGGGAPGMPAPNPPMPAAASPYKNASEVKAAVKAGKLSPKDGADILRRDFGFPK